MSEHSYIISKNSIDILPDDIQVISVRWGGYDKDTFIVDSLKVDSVKSIIIEIGLQEVAAVRDLTFHVQKVIDYITSNCRCLEGIYIFYDRYFINFDQLVSKIKIVKVNFPLYVFIASLTDKFLSIRDWSISKEKCLWMVGHPTPFDIRLRLEILHEFLYNDPECLEYSMFEIGSIHAPIRHNHGVNYLVNYLNKFYNLSLTPETLVDYSISLSKKFEMDAKQDPNFSSLLSKYIRQSEEHKLPFLDYVFMYPNKEWTDASLILLSESYVKNPIPYNIRWDNDYPFSEKIWKPIVTKKPFITYSENDEIYTHLEKLGFRTFLNYTSHPDKINLNIDDSQTALGITFGDYTSSSHIYEVKKYYSELVYKRTKSFLQNMKKYENQIREDVEYNYTHYQKIMKQKWEEICNLCPPLKRENTGGVLHTVEMDKLCYMLIQH